MLLLLTLVFLILGRQIAGFYFLAAGTAWASGVWFERAATSASDATDN